MNYYNLFYLFLSISKFFFNAAVYYIHTCIVVGVNYHRQLTHDIHLHTEFENDIFFLRVNSSFSNDGYSIENPYNISHYMLKNHVYRYIPDVVTFDRLKGENDKKTLITSDNFDILENYQRGEDIESFILKEVNNPDELLRIEILRINTLQTPSVLKAKHKIGMDIFNPSVTTVKLRLKDNQNLSTYVLMSHRGKRWADSQNYLNWVDIRLSLSSTSMKTATNFESDTIFGINTGYGTSLGVNFTKAEDIRLLTLSDESILLSFTVFIEWMYKVPFCKMAESILTFDQVSNTFSVSELRFLIKETDRDVKKTQKNWVPFLHNNEVLYIDSIHPLHVLGYGESNVTENTIYMQTKSLSSCLPSENFVNHDKWFWGEIRGGSPALLISQRNIYLSFFHSRVKVPGSNLWTTYFFGAFTFTATLPFEVISISRVPIINNDLYDGMWANNPPFDYILYPMGFYLEDENITLSFGRNDQEGWVGLINLDELLNSLVPFTCHRNSSNSHESRRRPHDIKTST